MKKLLLIIIAAVLLFTVSCSMQAYVPPKDEVLKIYNDNSEDFLSAAMEVTGLNRNLVISHTDNYSIQSDDESFAEYKGLYLSNTEGGYEKYDSELLTRLLTEDGAKSVSASADDSSVCEFNCGGGGRYYRGVYYSADGEPKNLLDSEGELTDKDSGMFYESESAHYYTEQIDDNFYYYELDS